MHFTRSVKPLQTVPRLLNTPVGLERARSRRGIEAASATADRKILLIAEDMPTTRGFTFAWLGDGVRWTPMTYALFPLTSRQAPDPARRPDPDPRSRPAPAALCDGKFRGDCLFPGPAGPDAYFCRHVRQSCCCSSCCPRKRQRAPSQRPIPRPRTSMPQRSCRSGSPRGQLRAAGS
jgi:hypothetical protein